MTYYQRQVALLVKACVYRDLAAYCTQQMGPEEDPELEAERDLHLRRSDKYYKQVGDVNIVLDWLADPKYLLVAHATLRRLGLREVGVSRIGGGGGRRKTVWLTVTLSGRCKQCGKSYVQQCTKHEW